MVLMTIPVYQAAISGACKALMNERNFWAIMLTGKELDKPKNNNQSPVNLERLAKWQAGEI